MSVETLVTIGFVAVSFLVVVGCLGGLFYLAGLLFGKRR